MKYLLYLIAILCAANCNAQIYNGSGGAINDNSNNTNFFSVVIGLDSSQLNGNYGLETICLDITHPNVDDLDIRLLAPDNTSIELFSPLGSGGSDFTGTCFNEFSAIPITSGNAPFSGNYIPRESLGNFNNGQAGTGTWRLLIQDLAPGDSGTLNSWSLQFGTSPAPPLGGNAQCNNTTPGGCYCPDSISTVCKLLPDMIVSEDLIKSLSTESFGEFALTVSTANIGWGPLEIIGTGLWYCDDSLVSGSVPCPSGGYSAQKVDQRLYEKVGASFFNYIDSSVGTMSFHSNLGHSHLHVDEWTYNTIRIKGPDPDPSTWPIIGNADKSSFCVIDLVSCSGFAGVCTNNGKVYGDGDIANFGLGQGYSNCNNSLLQGISPGYADIYGQSLSDQKITFDSICNGDYYVVSIFDPFGRFIETNKSNNSVAVPVNFTNQLSGCCETNITFENISTSIIQFIDSSVAIPNKWSWDFGDGSTDSIQFPIHTFTDTGTYTVILETETAQGCQSSDTIIFRIDSLENCVANILIEIVDSNYNFKLRSLDTNFSSSWHWEFGDNTSGTGKTVSKQYFDDGVYEVILNVTGHSGCTDSDTLSINVSNAIAPQCFADFSFEKSQLIATQINFTNQSTSNGIIDSYFWEFGDGKSSNKKNPNHVFDQMTVYNISLTVTDITGLGCMANITKPINVLNTSVNDEKRESGFIVYPNPSKGKIELQFHEIFKKVEVLNTLGMVIHEMEIAPDQDHLMLELDESGYYWIRVLGEKSQEVRSILINK